jgi:Pin2-interacting protein X1
MTSQGWQPGEYLGAKDAAHAEFHTAANASHIRVLIKDDNLGLGAKVGSGVGHGECTGLDAFKNLLGRLNGKDEDEIEKEQKSRDDLRRAIYTEKRWGSIRFVSGGFLIGDKIQILIDAEAERVRNLALGSSESSDSSSSDSEDDSAAVVTEKPTKSKKRKIEAMEENEDNVVAMKTKKSKKDKSRKSKPTPEVDVESAEGVKISKKSKKDRNAKVNADDTPDEAELKRRKKEKRERKEQKRKERAAEIEGGDSESKKKKKSKKDKHKDKDAPAASSESSQATTKENTPLVSESSGRSTPMMQGRHAVRARNIAQKRMASMDLASLNQVSKYHISNLRYRD